MAPADCGPRLIRCTRWNSTRRTPGSPASLAWSSGDRKALSAPGAARVSFIFDRWLDWVESEGGPGGCPIMQASGEYDDQPGRVRDFLQVMHRRWAKTLEAEVRAISAPPPPPEAVSQAVFDIKSYVKDLKRDLAEG